MAIGSKSLRDWTQAYLHEEAPRSKSLIVTVFGDSVAPYASSIWLSELIDLLVPFGVNERLVRTSCFRLVDEKWLRSIREGRRSRYGLTPAGFQRFEHAYRRIYTPPPQDWSGNWTLVLLAKKSRSNNVDVSELRRELQWEGFATYAPGVLVHPDSDVSTLAEILDRNKGHKNAVVLEAKDLPDLSTRTLQQLINDDWELNSVADRYRNFLMRFTPLMNLIDSGSPLSDLDAFTVQTLLIHSFRRVTLHDPRLPPNMLPETWPGHDAYELARKIYRCTYAGSGCLMRSRLDPGERVSPSTQTLMQRFGGLE